MIPMSIGPSINAVSEFGGSRRLRLSSCMHHYSSIQFVRQTIARQIPKIPIETAAAGTTASTRP